MTTAALHKLTRARAALVVTQPFWGVLALNMKLIEEPGLGTMATDGKSIAYDPQFVLSLSDPELRGVIAHEVSHVAQLHHTRRGNRNPERWNQAADHAINPNLLAGGFKLPAGGLNNPRFRNMGAEAIYAKLAQEEAKRQERQPQQQQGDASQDQQGGQQDAPGQSQGQGQPQTGQGKPSPASAKPQASPGAGQPSPGDAGEPSSGQSQPGQEPGKQPSKPQQSGKSIGAGKPGAFGQVRDAPGGEAGRAAAEAKAQQNVRQAAMVAKAQGAGKLPGDIAELIAELDKPRVDWRATLRRFADKSAIRETSWNRPNRRFANSPFILPGKESVALSHLVAVIDTSGSVDSAALAAIGGELQAMLDKSACERLSVIFADSRVQRVEEAGAGDVLILNATGRGGTAFAPAFAWIADNASDAAAIVYLTDGDASDLNHLTAPSAPVLWAMTSAHHPTMPFGECVPIDPET